MRRRLVAVILTLSAAVVQAAGPIAECKRGLVAFENGLSVSVPNGYCLSFGQHVDFVAGSVLKLKTGEVLLSFYAGTAGPPIEVLREHGYDTNCIGPVRESATGYDLATPGISGALVQRVRTTVADHTVCKDSVFFTRSSPHSESASLLVFTYSTSSERVANLADQLIASVHPTKRK